MYEIKSLVRFILKKVYLTLVFFYCFISVFASSKVLHDNHSSYFKKRMSSTEIFADSIMLQVIDRAEEYKNIVSRYEAEIYVKGRTEILKKNFLMRFAHHLYPVDWKNKDMFFEMVSQSKFNAPNTYLHDFEAINGNSIPNSAKQQEMMTYLNLNVYSPTAYNDGILMPLAKDAFKYYRFNLEDQTTDNNMTIFKIRFTPRQHSQRLICGDLYVIDKAWTIDKIDLHGRYDFAEFNLEMSYSRNFRRFLMPEKANLFLRYRTLGNCIATTYHSTFKYKEVEWMEKDFEKKNNSSLDLTSYYLLSSDTVAIVRDSLYWEEKRDVPLTTDERQLLQSQPQKIKELSKENDMDSTAIKYLKLTEQLTNTVNRSYNKTTRIKYSGILNPFQLGYSARNGITYKQLFRFSKTFDKDRQLRFYPEMGYVFKRKEVFFKVGTDWEYKPEKMGTFSLLIANGNLSYPLGILKEITTHIKDSAFQIENLNLRFFKHYYVDLHHSIELFHGFQITNGISYHHRNPVKNQSNLILGNQVDQIINKKYCDFLIDMGFSYTPRQYYRMDGHRKEYIYSRYPTISLHIARGIPGIGNSSGNYTRLEADIHQTISLGLLRKINYHLSGGCYTRLKSTYFAEFEYFAKRNFPDTWADGIGGVFNQLNSIWYNAANRYVQAHFMYQSPFILSQLIKPLSTKYTSRYILSERFYVSQLWTPVLPSYTEVGYGVGNHIFNIALFAGFDRWKYQSMGLKIAFELFK